jgi:hypothetical protein
VRCLPFVSSEHIHACSSSVSAIQGGGLKCSSAAVHLDVDQLKNGAGGLRNGCWVTACRQLADILAPLELDTLMEGAPAFSMKPFLAAVLPYQSCEQMDDDEDGSQDLPVGDTAGHWRWT